MRRAILIAVFLAGSVGSAFAHHIAMVVDHDNTVQDVSARGLAAMLETETKVWPDGKPVVLVLHRDPAHEVAVLERVGNMPRQRAEWFIAEHRRAIHFVDTDEAVLQAVHTTPGAIGFVDVRSIDEGVNVVKVDGKLPLEKGYVLP